MSESVNGSTGDITDGMKEKEMRAEKCFMGLVMNGAAQEELSEFIEAFGILFQNGCGGIAIIKHKES
jgi:hypothetical protein